MSSTGPQGTALPPSNLLAHVTYKDIELLGIVNDGAFNRTQVSSRRKYKEKLSILMAPLANTDQDAHFKVHYPTSKGSTVSCFTTAIWDNTNIGSANYFFGLAIKYWDGTNRWNATVKLTAQTLFQYANSSATFVSVPGAPTSVQEGYYNNENTLSFAKPHWHTIGFGINFSTNQYLWAYLDGTYYDLSGIALQSSADTASIGISPMNLELWCHGTNAGVVETDSNCFYFDSGDLYAGDMRGII